MTNLMQNPSFTDFIGKFQELCKATQTVSFDEARRLSTQFFLPPNLVVEPVKAIVNKEIRAKDEHLVPIRIYSPEKEGILPLIVYFHRGGWVFGNVEEADPVCRKLANHLGAVVISVDYRLCPEHPFPKPLDDCYAAVLWASENAGSLNADPSKLILFGESCGGNLAAACALTARDTNGPRIFAQVLVCPMISSTIHDHSYEISADKYFITKDAIKFFWSVYLSLPEHAGNPYAALERVKSLANLPPALIVTAEYDPLQHEAYVFAERLKHSGVNVVTKCFKDVVHGFIDLPVYDEDQKNRWIDEIGELFGKLHP